MLENETRHTLGAALAAFLGAAFLGAGAFFFPTEKVISILKAATGATRRAAIASFMVDIVSTKHCREVGRAGKMTKSEHTTSTPLLDLRTSYRSTRRAKTFQHFWSLAHRVRGSTKAQLEFFGSREIPGRFPDQVQTELRLRVRLSQFYGTLV